jgi:hypothetical protein
VSRGVVVAVGRVARRPAGRSDAGAREPRPEDRPRSDPRTQRTAAADGGPRVRAEFRAPTRGSSLHTWLQERRVRPYFGRVADTGFHSNGPSGRSPGAWSSAVAPRQAQRGRTGFVAAGHLGRPPRVHGLARRRRPGTLRSTIT